MKERKGFRFEDAEDIICNAFLLLMLGAIMTNIILNWTVNKRLSALEELGTGAYMFGVYTGFGLLYKRRNLTSVSFVVNKVPLRVRYFIELLTHAYIAFFSGTMTYHGVLLCLNSTIKRMPALNISYVWLDLCIVFGFGTMTIRALIRLVRHALDFRKIVIMGGAEK